MLSKGFGEVGDSKGASGNSTTGSQFLEQFKTAKALAQLAAQHSQSGPSSTGPSSWESGPASLAQYGKGSLFRGLVAFLLLVCNQGNGFCVPLTRTRSSLTVCRCLIRCV